MHCPTYQGFAHLFPTPWWMCSHRCGTRSDAVRGDSAAPTRVKGATACKKHRITRAMCPLVMGMRGENKNQTRGQTCKAPRIIAIPMHRRGTAANINIMAVTLAIIDPMQFRAWHACMWVQHMCWLCHLVYITSEEAFLPTTIWKHQSQRISAIGW